MNDSFLLGKTIQNPSREQRACLLRASVLKKQSTNQSLRTSRERNDSAAGAKSQMTQTPSLPLACSLPLCVVCKTKTNNETYMYWTMRSRKGVFPIVCVCVCACVGARRAHRNDGNEQNKPGRRKNPSSSDKVRRRERERKKNREGDTGLVRRLGVLKSFFLFGG